MSLTASPVTELSAESAPKLLFHEWLSKFFDGAAHDVGQTMAVPFPRAEIAFDTSDIMQPLEASDDDTVKAEIRCICLVNDQDNCRIRADGLLAADRVTFQFWVRAMARDMAEARGLGQEVAEKLAALLRNPATRFELAEKGVAHLRPRKPQLVPSVEYILYIVGCAARLNYEILF